jgi:Ca2+-binding EF-hand superfamily protein
MFTAQSRSRDEAELHQHLHAIFDETPEKISARSQLESAAQYSSLADRSIEEFQDKLPESSQVSFSVLKPIQDQLNDLVVRVRANIWQLLTPQIPVSYENAGVQAAEALFSAIGLGLTAHGLAAAADLIHPLKATAIPQIAAFLADMAGFGAIARATWYEDIHNFLTLPYRYFSQRYFRPTLPRESDVYRMYSKSLIREEDFRRSLEYMGYRNEWIDVFVDDAYREPSALNLTLMAQDPTIDLATIYKTLRRGGYSPDVSEIFTRAIQIKSLSAYMQDYREALTSLYANGYISESQLDDQMAPLQLASEAYFLVKKTAEFQFLKKYIDDEIKMFTDQFEKGLIDDTQLKTILTALGLKPEKIDLIVSAQKIKIQPNILAEENEKIKDEIRKAQQDVIENYLLAYRAGSISADELKQALVLIGFSDEAAGLAVKVEEARQALVVSRKTADTVQRQKEQTIRNYEKAYVYQFRNGLIDADQLRAALSFLGLPDDYVNSVVELEVSKKEKPPKVTIN